MNDNLKRGTIEIVLLTLLKDGDKYGYELTQALDEKSQGLFPMKETALYPVLYRLQHKGLISDRCEQVGVRRTRIYYHLEPSGSAYLEESIREYISLTRGIFNVLGYSDLGDAEQ